MWCTPPLRALVASQGSKTHEISPTAVTLIESSELERAAVVLASAHDSLKEQAEEGAGGDRRQATSSQPGQSNASAAALRR